MLGSSEALAGGAQAGFDHFVTDPDTTFIDFRPDPIPADFFGPGCDPFNGTINFQGAPIGPGNTDTIVERLQDGNLPFPPASTDTVDIEIVELHLRSSQPIQVDCRGDQTFWDVEVNLEPAPPSQGQMTIDRLNEQGGTSDSFFDVFFEIDFTPQPDGAPMSRLLRGYTTHSDIGMPWQHTHCKLPFLGGSSTFCAGVANDLPVLTIFHSTGDPEQHGAFQHGLFPAEQPNAVGGVTQFLDGGSSSSTGGKAIFASSVAGVLAVLLGGGWYTRRRWLRSRP